MFNETETLALCLMQFNNHDEQTLEEMLEATNIEDGEMRRTLQVIRKVIILILILTHFFFSHLRVGKPEF